MQPKRLLVTGGAGFIGSAFIRYALKNALKAEQVVNLDLLTYAADLKHLKEIENDRRYLFVQGDIRDGRLVEELLRKHAIDTLVHFAAETHVDRSIEAPPLFYDTNIGGTIALLEAAGAAPSSTWPRSRRSRASPDKRPTPPRKREPITSSSLMRAPTASRRLSPIAATTTVLVKTEKN